MPVPVPVLVLVLVLMPCSCLAHARVRARAHARARTCARARPHAHAGPRRVWKGGSGLLNPAIPLNPVGVPECVFWSNTPTLFADVVKSDTPVQ